MKNIILILLILLGILHAEVENNKKIDYKEKFAPYTTKEIVSNSANLIAKNTPHPRKRYLFR